VRDRQAGVVERVSVGTNGQQGNGDGSEGASISSDGRYVAFDSDATTFAPGTTPELTQVYVRDRIAGTLTLVSINASGKAADGNNSHASISGDGRYIAFESSSTTIVPNDHNLASDVFVRDRQAGTTILVSATPAGAPGNGESRDPAISLDGRYVSFYTFATDLTPGSSGRGDIVIRDLLAGTTQHVASLDTSFEGTSSISADGRFVAFFTEKSLVPDDTNSSVDTFVFDRVTKSIERVSVSSSGAQGTGANGERISISGDGRVVAWDGYSPDIVANDFNDAGDVYVRVRDATSTSALQIQPRSMDIGAVKLGASRSGTFSLHNGGTSTVDIARIGIRGTDRAMFKLTNQCGLAIEAGVTCNCTITFKPTSLGLKQARLRVELADGTVIWRKIQGTGVSP
jgi:Tol biopolymer transport system component